MLNVLVGSVAVCIGVWGYSTEIDEYLTDLDAIRAFSFLFVALAIEFLVHALTFGDPKLHAIVHDLMALTVSVGGYWGIRLMRGRLSEDALKEMIVYVAVVWLLGRNVEVSDYPSVYYVLVIVSLIIAVTTFYVFFKVRSMRAFFMVESRLIKGGYFVVALIGLSAVETDCMVPIILSAIVEVYVLYLIVKLAEPFVIRR